MSTSPNSSLPSDVCLLLRADAERHWLHREVIPVLRQMEAGDLGEEEAQAALAYLEAVWAGARVRARNTDEAAGCISPAEQGDSELSTYAGRYHAAVCVLREIVAARVAPLVQMGTQESADALDGAPQLATQAPDADGCAPQAA